MNKEITAEYAKKAQGGASYMSVRMGFLDLLVVLTEVGDIYRINFFGLPPIRSYLSDSK